jgi:hypothetical protein
VKGAIRVRLPLLSSWDASEPIPSSEVKIAVKLLIFKSNYRPHFQDYLSTPQLTNGNEQQRPATIVIQGQVQ